MFGGKASANDAFVGIIGEPAPANFPERMRGAETSREQCAVRNGKRVLIPGPNQSGSNGSGSAYEIKIDRNVEKRREAENVVTPENHFELAEIGFAEISAFVDWTVIDAADVDGKRVGLRGDDKIRAQAAEFAREAVADFEGNRERGGGIAMPTISAAAASSLRRGLRMKDSLT